MNLGLIKTAFQQTLLVGESACQVKPWSCGGVVYGFACADIARDVILEAFRKQDFSEQVLSRYDREWKAELGGNISLGMTIRSMLKQMTCFPYSAASCLR